jgi:hypothetical protein
LFESGDRCAQHLLVGVRPRGEKIRTRSCKCQLERPPLGVRFSLLRRQLAAEATSTFGLRLLKLNVLAFESSSHACDCPAACDQRLTTTVFYEYVRSVDALAGARRRR